MPLRPLNPVLNLEIVLYYKEGTQREGAFAPAVSPSPHSFFLPHSSFFFYFPHSKTEKEKKFRFRFPRKKLGGLAGREGNRECVKWGLPWSLDVLNLRTVLETKV